VARRDPAGRILAAPARAQGRMGISGGGALVSCGNAGQVSVIAG